MSKAIQESCDPGKDDITVPEKDDIQRKQWEAKPFRPLMFPLEATASAMEGGNNVDEQYFDQ